MPLLKKFSVVAANDFNLLFNRQGLDEFDDFTHGRSIA